MSGVRAARGMLAAAFVVAAGAGIPVADGLAQGKGPGGYPIRPVRLLVPNVPGGTTDMVARLIAPKLADEIGQPVVIDNRGGASGLIARDMALRAPGDGYTLLLSNQAIVIASVLQEKAGSDLTRDFNAFAWIGIAPNVLVAHPSVPAKTLSEFIPLLKAKELSFGSGGIGSATHMGMELFFHLSGTGGLHVPYKSAGPALTDTVSGHVQFLLASMPSALPYIRSGKLRAYGIGGTRRSKVAPELPTLAEAGVRGYAYETWYGMFAVSSLSRPLVGWLNTAANRVLADPAVVARLTESGIESGSETPEAAQKFFVEDVARWRRLIRDTGIRAQ
ncbi:MAG: tripartite tricarboxylate transporter substrate binding protein [bacterium]|nr:tripartite tricarboxylate transporter substrate binding protein [Betaproteobacteria bacterium]